MATASRRVLLRQESGTAAAVRAGVHSGELHRYALWAGVALALVSLGNFLLVWWTPGAGTPQWEFAVVSQSLDRMPLLVLSVTMLAVAVPLSGARWATRAVAVFCAGLVAAVLGMGLLFATASAAVWSTAQQASPDGAAIMTRALAKNAALSLTYAALFAAMAITLWRRTRPRPKT